MERAVQIFAVVNLAVISVSHILRPRPWVQFYVMIRGQGEAGVFALAFLTLIFGSIIVAFHNVWTGLPIVLTLFGWTQVLKGLFYFWFPAHALRKLHIPTEERANMFVGGGLFSAAIAGAIAYHLWATS